MQKSKYRVNYMARQENAIGNHYPVPIEVIAYNVWEARARAFEQLHKNGYETIHLISVEYICSEDYLSNF